MKCESLSLDKYLDKSPNIFFIYGSEVVLKNSSKDKIINFLSKKGFNERRFIAKEQFNKIEQTIIESLNGSLFGSKLIIEINHDQGKISEEIIKIFNIDSLFNSHHIAVIINSHNEKLNSSTKWVKNMDRNSLIVECKKLKSFEEKIWLKHQLSFIPEDQKQNIIQNFYEMNTGNLVAQQNEINILKLLNKNSLNTSDIYSEDSAEFSPYDLEDVLISMDTKLSLRIIHSIKESESHFAPLIVWIIGKIINNSTLAKQNDNPKHSLEKSGIWNNKINNYMQFVKSHSLKKFISMQKSIYELDLSSKGLNKRNFWNDLDSLIINLTN